MASQGAARIVMATSEDSMSTYKLMRRQLFRGERLVIWAMLAVGVFCTAAVQSWTGLVWCLIACVWWRYSCLLEDRLDAVGK